MTIKARVLHSLKWMILARGITQLIRWSVTFFVIRLLMPEDYGLMAIADVIVSFLVLFSSAGFASSIIQKQSVNDQQLSALFGVIVLVNLLLMALLWFATPSISAFYHDERLIEVFHWMLIGFMFGSFDSVPNAILSKQMQFKTLSVISVIATLISSLSTLIMAIQGMGYKALLFGYLIDIGLQCILKNIAIKRLILPSLQFSIIKDLLKFGGTLTIATLLWFIFSRYDVLIAGHLWEASTLGFYVIALQIAFMPLDKVTSLVRQVAFPAFASQANKENRPNLERYVLKANRLSMQMIIPVFFGVSLIAPLMIPILLGDKWLAVIFPLQVISLVLPLRVSMDLLGTAVKGCGLSHIIMKEVITASLIMLPAMTIGAQYGIQGLSLAWVLAYPCVFLLNTRRALIALNINIKAFAVEMLPPLSSAFIMYVMGVFAQFLLQDTVAAVWVMVWIILQSIILYTLLQFCFAKEYLYEVWHLFSKR